MAGKRSRSKKSSSFVSAASTAQAAQSETVLPSQSGFDPIGDYFAVVTPSADEHRLRIFDTKRNDAPVVMLSPSSMADSLASDSPRNYTCLACGLVRGQPADVCVHSKQTRRAS